MATGAAYILDSPSASGPDTGIIPVRDDLITDTSNQTAVLFDLAFGWCYPGGALATRPAPGNPLNNAVVQNMTDGANSSVIVGAANEIVYAGGGFDFTAATTVGDIILSAAGLLSSIYSSGQNFAVMTYERFPTSANYMSNSGTAPHFCTAPGTGGYASAPDLVTLTEQSDGLTQRTFQARRQTNGSSTIVTTQMDATPFFGKVIQVLFWRDANNCGLRLQALDGTATNTVLSTRGADNTGDFSQGQGRFGVPAAFNGPGNLTTRNRRLYRGGVINLANLTKTAVQIADADMARVNTRIAASKAANGGNSLIFV